MTFAAFDINIGVSFSVFRNQARFCPFVLKRKKERWVAYPR
jgi:hypothetical protein